MSKGIYSALSGAMAQNQQLDTIANNIANATTPGFKADHDAFKEYLTVLSRPPDVNTVPKIPASIESFYDMQGTSRSYAVPDGTYSDFSQGGLKASGNPLDIALEGKGFVEVLTPQGPRLTRKGAFTLGADGTLQTQDGYQVLKRDTPGTNTPPQNRIIRFARQGPITFTRDGGIFQGGQNLGQLSIVEVVDNNGLRKIGNSLWAMGNLAAPRVLNPTTVVHQGFIETSNVNLVKEMTDLIQTSRNFESDQRMIKAFDEMDGKLVNDVPKL